MAKGCQTLLSFYWGFHPAAYRILECIGILFYLFVFYSFLFDLVCQVRHREARVNATTVFFETVINKLVLILKTKCVNLKTNKKLFTSINFCLLFDYKRM